MVALVQENTIVDKQLRLYEEQGKLTVAQSGVRDLAAVVGLGLHLYHFIRNLDDDWARSADPRSSEPDIDGARQFAKLYGRWLEVSKQLLLPLRQLEKSGAHLIGAAEFRDACAYVGSVLSFDLERLYAPMTGGKTAAEVRDGLRHHL